jgi:hypothetical protein
MYTARIGVSDFTSYTTVCPAFTCTRVPVPGTWPLDHVAESDQFPLRADAVQSSAAKADGPAADKITTASTTSQRNPFSRVFVITGLLGEKEERQVMRGGTKAQRFVQNPPVFLCGFASPREI